MYLEHRGQDGKVEWAGKITPPTASTVKIVPVHLFLLSKSFRKAQEGSLFKIRYAHFSKTFKF